ncbi:DNA-binding storekeeper protein-related transcriptional regulator [Rhynchospora pubera]|uniref:DNA-binding storekeeper protein-related transcriptional regulator n=1 Tax=Rhynchospora pubera TaxID=906938 RepID=A0AAV8FKR8_9POAL|nr:DNA-binding storekeeper protein-related transcriptional regulator [Rhynchospora pubera]
MATPDHSQSQPNPDPTQPNPQTPIQTQTLATPTPTPTPFPRKLPIKRKQSPSRIDPSPSSDAAAADPPTGDVRSPPPSTGDIRSPQPPFKFQRIWSESDEIRFLQGLLGCKSQGLVFPRDLNLFYDQFSANMPQPYTRSQLSEKLRRLKNKHKSATARIARNGLDPSRITPHDKDVLHLCSRLWDPQNAASSPFFSTTPGVSGNKRRRANPRPLPNSDDGMNTYDDEANEDNEGNFESSSHSVPLTEERAELLDNMLIDSDLQSETMKSPSPSPFPSPSPIKIEASNNDGNRANNRNSVNDGNKSKQVKLRLEIGDNGSVIAKAMLDVFEECLKEIGLKCSEETGDDAIQKKWRALRVAELDVLARRMRLMIEDATAVAR